LTEIVGYDNLLASGFTRVTLVPMKLPNIKAVKTRKLRDEESVSSASSQRKDDRKIARPMAARKYHRSWPWCTNWPSW